MTKVAQPTSRHAPPLDERRQHQRFKTPEKTMAITPDVIGQIIDISASGCKVRYIDNSGKLSHESAMDILLNDYGFYLEQIPIAMAWQDRLESTVLSTIIIRKAGIRFAALTPSQQERIDDLIKQYALEAA